MHHKHGKGVFFCSEPVTCQWNTIYAPRPSKWGFDKPSESSNSSSIRDTLYKYKQYPKMYEICDNEIKEESESHSIQARWSHKSNVAQVSSVQSYRPSLVRQFYSSHLKTWIPWSLHLSQRNHGEDIALVIRSRTLVNLLMRSRTPQILKWI